MELIGFGKVVLIHLEISNSVCNQPTNLEISNSGIKLNSVHLRERIFHYVRWISSEIFLRVGIREVPSRVKIGNRQALNEKMSSHTWSQIKPTQKLAPRESLLISDNIYTPMGFSRRTKNIVLLWCRSSLFHLDYANLAWRHLSGSPGTQDIHLEVVKSVSITRASHARAVTIENDDDGAEWHEDE